MERDIDRDLRESARIARPERTDRVQERPEQPQLAREAALIRLRGMFYRLTPSELGTLRDVGRFRTVAVNDLARVRYAGQLTEMRRDFKSLRAQGLMRWRTVWTGPRREALDVLVLTKLGRELLERQASIRSEAGTPAGAQAVYAGFVKANEVRHDAAIYRMFQAERERIERAGGQVRRVVLDYELKRNVYAPLAKARHLSPAEYARRQAEVARQNGLVVVAGKIPLPDLRVEYVDQEGELARVDLELATGHYHAPALRAKAAAGFKFYAPADSRARLTRVLEERDITVAILSL
jgi:hypothetical protein